jgi:hypothetical protein
MPVLKIAFLGVVEREYPKSRETLARVDGRLGY